MRRRWVRATHEGTVGTEGKVSPQGRGRPQLCNPGPGCGSFGQRQQLRTEAFCRPKTTGTPRPSQGNAEIGGLGTQVTARVHALRRWRMPKRTPAITFHPSSQLKGNPRLPEVPRSSLFPATVTRLEALWGQKPNRGSLTSGYGTALAQ